LLLLLHDWKTNLQIFQALSLSVHKLLTKLRRWRNNNDEEEKEEEEEEPNQVAVRKLSCNWAYK